MSYSSPFPAFPRNLIVLSFSRWWSAEQASQLLISIQANYFPAHSVREASLSLLASAAPAPFTLNTRFPAGAFITDADPLLLSIIAQLTSALSYSDRLLNKTGTAQTSNDATYLAAKATYSNGLLALATYIRDPANYYDQSSFEAQFGLTWSILPRSSLHQQL
jgi:hypothetical protein